MNCWPKLKRLLFVAILPSLGQVSAVDFEKEVFPLLQQHCLDCHDRDKQKSGFRLDRLSSLLRGGDSGERAVIPGNPGDSFLLKAIRHEESGYEMPPKGDPLTGEQISRIEQWILEGAKTPARFGPAQEKVILKHWSFLPLKRPEQGNSVDDLILAKLSQNGLTASPAADRRTLIRRLYLVMLGLPPTPREVDRFLKEDDWTELVERVLASPHYGERWATHWLDLVRFGETHGFETNRERPHAWRYRDWVVESFNADKAYDQFVREQIAGDAMGAEIGTGFLVAGPYDSVKGRDPKLGLMQRMNELDDMINTTGTGFLGLTLGCARCHNHKFDPVTQSDYYSLQAIFAGVKHGDRNRPLPEGKKVKVTRLDAEIAALRKQLAPFVRKSTDAIVAIDDARADHIAEPKGKGRNPAGLKPGQAGDPGSATRAPNVSGGEYTWWKNTPGKEIAAWRPHLEGPHRVWLSWGSGHSTHTRDAHYFLQTSKGKRTLVARVNQQLLADGSGTVSGQSLWSGFRNGGVHDWRPGDSLVLVGGQIGTAITADIVLFEPISDDELSPKTKPVRPAIREPVKAAHNRERFAPTEARFVRFTIEACSTGSQPCIDELEIFSGKKNVALGAKATSSGDFKHPLHKLAHINDGKFGNARSWIAAKTTGWVQIELPGPVKIDRIEWARDREKKYTDRVPVKYRIEAAMIPGQWRLLTGSDDRLPFGSGSQKSDIRYDFDSHPPAEAELGRKALSRINAATKEREIAFEPDKIYAGIFQQPGPTHRLYRGEPDAKREEVGPNAIAAFASLDLEKTAPEQQRRIALAGWITSPENPLTARVIVNRIWQFHFGTGIVDTPSDFGSNGTPPSHPELLDWLALELMDHDWSLKHIHRLILHSRTWQQSNRPREAALQVDAGTRLLWRFPPRRLEAEGIRDSILHVSGVLDLEKRGGPGFHPFEVTMENVRHYHPKKSYGSEDWRRMIYMTKVRQERESVFGAFDCPDASQAVPKRSRSTTPLQALNLLNSRFVMQQAELFAERLRGEAPTPEEQVRLAWELSFNRKPNAMELADSTAFIKREGLIPFTRAILNTNEFVFIP